MTDDANVTESHDDATATVTQAVTKPKRTSSKSKLPASVRNAARTGQASQLARAIAANLGITIDPKQFRDTLRRKHGYVSGKHGTKLTLSDKVASDMLAHYAEVKKRRSGK